MRGIEEIKDKFSAKVWGVRPTALPGMIVAGEYECFVRLPDCGTCRAIFGYNEDGWEHVSIVPKKKFTMPSWEDMAALKEIFFGEEEEAYQIMPKHSEYVNIHERCLHLWRPANGKRLGDIADENNGK
ncbi:MAG: hypothetical protein WCS21_08550 [Lachnospiraceae bacterium]